jgi:thiol-disulfide isomerase/thioredoxin
MRMISTWRCISVAALGLAPVALGITTSISPNDIEAADVPYVCSPAARPANLELTLKDLRNADVLLSSFKGKVLLVNFWATWCGPCKIEIPWFVDLQTRYGDQGLQVLGISIDDPLALLEPYAAEHKMNYPVLQGLGHRDIVESFGPLRGVPTTMIISRDGKLCAKHIGVTPRDGFEAQVKGLLK